MAQSSCKRDTKKNSHPGMKDAPVRVFSCKHPLTNYFSHASLLAQYLFSACAIQPDLHVIRSCSQQKSHNFFGTGSRYGKVKKNNAIFDFQDDERNALPNLRRWLTTSSRVIYKGDLPLVYCCVVFWKLRLVPVSPLPPPPPTTHTHAHSTKFRIQTPLYPPPPHSYIRLV